MATIQALKAQSARLGWHLWGEWFRYALAAAVIVGLFQGGMAVVGWLLAVVFLSIPVLLLQAAVENRLFPDTGPAAPQPGDVIRDPRTGQPVVNQETHEPYTVPDATAGDTLLINPATGALMVGGMGGVDVLGNPFGSDLASSATGGDVFDHGSGYDGMGDAVPDYSSDADYSSFDSSSDFDSSDTSSID